jgi:hypothetical protein
MFCCRYIAVESLHEVAEQPEFKKAEICWSVETLPYFLTQFLVLLN